MGNILSKFIDAVKRFQRELFLGSCIVLISIISYNLGQINSLKKTPISVIESAGTKADILDAVTPKSSNQSIEQKTQPQKLDTRVVASKNSDKYHYLWCSGAKRIKEENKIWFSSAREAEDRGYTLAGNCAP